MIARTRLVPLLVALLVCAASAASQPSAAQHSSAAAQLRKDAFGGTRWGFTEASTANGRLVVLRRFHDNERPSFGRHGETSAKTELTLFDRVTGKERTVSDVIDVNAQRRFLLVIADGGLWLVDSEMDAFEPLADADMRQDGNACLAPRQANFSVGGKRVAWVTENAGSLVVRDLATRAEWRVAAKQRIWRGWPEDEGRGTVMLEVAAGVNWPEQRTSCACRWCNRFAVSHGVYGWSGPSFSVERVAENGKRSAEKPPQRKGEWHGKTAADCELKARLSESGLERGPWQWRCP